ncbi:MAG: hypothetical protein JW941_06525 [Candidatus Coatesbacteria bacterium]|nr:hypothetical protein [Candidatus Coatesbacteria bacterium]
MTGPVFDDLTKTGDEGDIDMLDNGSDSLQDDPRNRENEDSDDLSLDSFTDKGDSADDLLYDFKPPVEPKDRKAFSDNPGEDDSGLGSSDSEQPAVIGAFSEIERRIKRVVQEKKQLIEERDELLRQFEEANLKIAELETKIDDLLSIEEKYRSHTDQQEMVRTKVESLLSLLETEED